MRILTSFGLAIGLAAFFAASCAPSIDVDTGEGPDELPGIDGPTLEFNPGGSVIPFPNNLLLDPATGLVRLPPQCNESLGQTALREVALNGLDGFGVFKSALSITFTEPVDPDSLSGNVSLFKRATGATPEDPSTAVAIPVAVIPGVTSRDSADCTTSSVVDNATFVPLIPLDPGSTYSIAVHGPVQTASNEPFLPSFTWGLVREADNPIVRDEAGNIIFDKTPISPNTPEGLATLEGIDRLWNAHAGALAFLEGTGLARKDILIAWEFNTLNTTLALDATVTGSPASALATAALDPSTIPAIVGGATPTQVINGATDNGCDAGLPCAAVGDIQSATFMAPNFTVDKTNAFNAAEPIPGAWPAQNKPAQNGSTAISALVFVPATAAPANGYPVVVFGHGLTRAQTDLFAIAAQLANAGYATVSINWPNHGDPVANPGLGISGRAIQITDDALLGCSGTPDPTAAPQCFASVLPGDFRELRDGARQGVIDHLGLIEAIKACGTSSCTNLSVDVARIGYVGQSLGGNHGATLTAMSPDIKAAVLNVPGAGTIDILENTDSLSLRCPFVNGLINAGAVEGDLFDPATPTVGACLTDEWRSQPTYRRLSVLARWILDPGENVNYLARLRRKTFLIQQVIGDEVIPNVATEQMGALAGLTPMAADVATGPPVAPSAAITTNPTDSKWVTYTTMTGVNHFGHGSLLQPDTADGPGQLGTAVVQTDAITFLVQNL